jgi:hypothetical protein
MTTSKTDSSIFDVYDGESPIATELRRLYHNAKKATRKALRSFLVTSSNRMKEEHHRELAGPHDWHFDYNAPTWTPTCGGRVDTLFSAHNAVGLKDCLAHNAIRWTRSRRPPPNFHVITAGTALRSPANY